MSQKQQEKQRIFREKLQAEGADGFADGPRPWEQWDESGNQGDDRIWEGTARRIYPKQQAQRSIGDRLLSGLAAVALATLLVGIAGVYLSTTSTPQLASSAIHPAPIVAADRPAQRIESTAADEPVSLASLETLQPPAAGKSAAPLQQQTVVLEPALQPAPTTDPVDRVAVETVITPAAITTTVYTQQPAQDQPQQVASIETTPPPFTPVATEQQAPVAMVAQDSEAPHIAEEPRAVATQDSEPAVTAEAPVTDVPEAVPADVAAEPEPEQQPATSPQLTAAAQTGDDTEQADAAADKPAVVETPATVAMNSTGTTADTAPDMSREIETATQTPVLPDAKTGKWVINLSSYTRKSTAERMLAVFREKGVEAEIFTTTINDKPMHRIRVAGFQSSRRAKSEIPAIEETLGLEGAWVSKR